MEAGTEPWESYKKYLASLLASLGAKTLSFTYDGGGDDGQVHDVSLHDAQGNHIPIPNGVYVKTWKSVSEFDDGSWVESGELVEEPAHKALQNLAYDLLEQTVETDTDWVNNDGGYGEITFDVNKMTFEIDHSERETKINSYDYSL